jgi:phage terminase large subunit-like protein
MSRRYAGFFGQSVLLEELYNRGKQLPLVGDSLHAGDGLIFAWHHKPVAPWQDEAWLTDMRRQRASVYQRHVLNEFAASASQYVELSKWDACVDASLGPLPNDRTVSIWVAIDAAHKHDQAAIVAVAGDQARQRLAFHRTFQPTPNDPLDFESTIERTLIDLRKRYLVRKVLFDPWQMQAVAQRLRRAGLSIEEFPQTQPNLTAASQNLFDLIDAQSLTLHPDAAMRLAASRAIAVEGARGWRIAKEKQSHKIDVIVALAMACYACTQGQAEPLPYNTNYAEWVDGTSAGASGESARKRSIRRCSPARRR